MAEFRGRLRISGREIDGNLQIPRALRRVKGIGTNLADSMSKKITETMKVPTTEKIGNLDEKQIKIIENMIADPVKYGLPEHLLNRRREYYTGTNTHLVGSDLDFRIKQDKQFQMALKSYKGVRYPLGLAVRGQRTKTQGRKGKTMGVQRKKKR